MSRKLLRPQPTPGSDEHALHPEAQQQRLPHLKDKWDFRPACREQTLQGQLDRLCAASRSSRAHWHLLWGFPVKVLITRGPQGVNRRRGFLIKAKAAVRLLQTASPAPALHHKGVMTLSTAAIGSQTNRTGRETPADTVSAHGHAPYREAPNHVMGPYSQHRLPPFP